MAQKLTNADVTTWLKLQAGDADGQLTMVVAAVNAYVGRLPVVGPLGAEAEWPATVRLGAAMLAARLWRRRNSPGGIEAITEAGTSYVARHDSDISRLLELDDYDRPRIG